VSAVRVLLGVWVLCAVCLLEPRRALACACCDSSGVVKAVGWSADGQNILLDARSNAGCEDTRWQSALRRGDQSRACFLDTREPPEYACGKPRKGPELSLKAADYPVAVRVIGAGHLRATSRVLSGGSPTPHTIDVHVFAGGEWRALWRGRVFPWSAYSEAESPPPGAGLDLEVVAALPTPDGKQALLVVAGFDSTPGIGSYGTSLVWVDLPVSVGAAAGQEARFETLPPYDIRKTPRYLDPIAPGPGRLAVFPPVAKEVRPSEAGSVSLNAMGLAAHRKGDYAASSRRFAEALASDPDNPFARYNLACAYARLDMPELAMVQLRIVAEQSHCPKCAERLVRARADEDFAALRSRPDFRHLVCGDAGDCFTPKAAAPAASAPPSPSGQSASSAASIPEPLAAPSARDGKGTCRCSVVSVRGVERESFAVGAVASVLMLRRRRRLALS
jgi:hypothetical protein